jgi:hypothetical protein
MHTLFHDGPLCLGRHAFHRKRVVFSVFFQNLVTKPGKTTHGLMKRESWMAGAVMMVIQVAGLWQRNKGQ